MANKINKRQGEVLKYLSGKDFTSPTEIGGLFDGHSATGSPICKRLVKLGFLERNKRGHYKLTELAKGCSNEIKIRNDDSWMCGYMGHLCEECQNKLDALVSNDEVKA